MSDTNPTPSAAEPAAPQDLPERETAAASDEDVTGGHTGGVNVLMGDGSVRFVMTDGSVRFVTDSISPTTK